MKLTSLTLASLIYVMGFLFLTTSNPKLFESQEPITQERCFIMFFVAGISAVFIYHIVLSIYD